ncbi:MAG: inositol monophosphatase [Planctomycetaceae bacterium]|nr:inositol monophosphatase [Planctomycetaceae bacterium]
MGLVMSLEDLAIDAAKQAGRLLATMQDSINPREKAPKDLVTEADVASQKRIFEIIAEARPTDFFLGEEDLTAESELPGLKRTVGASTDLTELKYCWVIDPLDGTANYVHKLQTYSVSIALLNYGDPIVAVVYDPVMDDCYSATRGEGARVNGDPIEHSGVEELSRALVAASFSAGVERGSPEVDRWVEMLYECQALRRLGSAALNLCYVAQGGLDGYWATSVKIWDIAAGILIVREAGGTITSFDGGPVRIQEAKFIAAATKKLHKQMFEVFNRL